ncbi:hypothetical protein ACQJBY_027566 [Aegilops geniculata]
MSTDGVELNWGVDGAEVCSAPLLPLESQDSMSVVNVDGVAADKPDAVGDQARYDVCSEATSGWTQRNTFFRVRIGKAPEEREMKPDRKTTLELSVRAYAKKRHGPVVNPTIGTSFDSLDEAYEFYNMYSWECGFGVRLAKSRLNVHPKRCMQEILCACASKPMRETVNHQGVDVKP